MTKHYCDWCGVDVTGKTSGALHGIQDADEQGNGTNTESWDVLCTACYQAFKTWVTTRRRANKQAGR